MKRSNKITIIVIAAVLVPLAVLIAVFSFIKNDDGFNTGTPVYQAQIVKNSGYSPYMSNVNGSRALVSGAHDSEAYDKFVKEYYAMTSFSVMRGILEWKWFPKAKLEDIVEVDEIEKLEAKEEQYLVTLDYPADSPISAELKVKKGTKDEPNSVKRGDDVYKEGEKVEFRFTTIVMVVDGENPYINDLTLYAFEKKDLDESEFVAYKIVVKANRIRFYQTCNEIFT